MLAMEKAKQQTKRKGNWRGPKTPTKSRKKDQIPVIGSSCTWRDAELQHFNVRVVQDVDVRGTMIPDKFWRFDGLKYYNECTAPPCLSLSLSVCVWFGEGVRVLGGPF